MCCNTLQHTATHCNTLQHTATHCNKLQQTATHCHMLQHPATRCNTLQHTAARCNTLQHTATHCSTLQHTATHCSTLQHTATHCKPPQTPTFKHIAYMQVMHLQALDLAGEGVMEHFEETKREALATSAARNLQVCVGYQKCCSVCRALQVLQGV